MRELFRSGIADTPKDYLAIASHAADLSLGYGPSLALADDRIAAVTVAYPEPISSVQTDEMPGVEIKLWRTDPLFRSWGLGRLTMKGAFMTACQEMRLAPGTAVRLHLDTRDPRSAAAFAAMGFEITGQATLYPAEAEQGLPDSPDLLFEKIVTVPDSIAS